jgi:hypothetical protein
MIFLGKRSRNDSALCIPQRRALPGALKITYEQKKYFIFKLSSYLK